MGYACTLRCAGRSTMLYERKMSRTIGVRIKAMRKALPVIHSSSRMTAASGSAPGLLDRGQPRAVNAVFDVDQGLQPLALYQFAQTDPRTSFDLQQRSRRKIGAG